MTSSLCLFLMLQFENLVESDEVSADFISQTQRKSHSGIPSFMFSLIILVLLAG